MDYETQANGFIDEAMFHELMADAIEAVLGAIPFLEVIDEPLLDFLATEVTREQVARAASAKEDDG